MTNPRRARAVFAAIGLTAFCLLLAAAYAQYGPGKQQPCPLCILQRYTYMLLTAWCLIAALHGPRGAGEKIYALGATIIAAFGTGLATWQVNRGASMTSCLADPIGEFVNGLPSANWWPEFLFANGGCADQYPPLFGLTVPVWSLVWFSFFTVAGVVSVAIASRATRPR